MRDIMGEDSDTRDYEEIPSEETDEEEEQENHEGPKGLEHSLAETDSDTIERIVNEKDDAVEQLMAAGLSSEDASQMVNSMYQSRNEHKNHHWDISGFVENMRAYLKSNPGLKNMAKGAWYLFNALFEGKSDRDPFKDIDNGAEYIFLTGYAEVPRDISKFEKELGKKCAYVNGTDPAYIKKVAAYMAAKHGIADFIVFSDGGKSVESVLNDGLNNVGSVHVIGSNPVTVNPEKSGPERYSHPRVHYYNGEWDLLAHTEAEYSTNFKGVKNVEVLKDAGHTWFFRDKGTIKDLASRINSHQHFGRNYPSHASIAKLYQKAA
ncbi:hypothetical protein GOV09_01990 [Candidatus Woesearchaeota archaeon]|nr:hypothetical protein [Candidatus Woesearchaeota archaeon]